MLGFKAVSTDPPTMPPIRTETKPQRKKMPKIWRSRPESEGFLHRYCISKTLIRLNTGHQQLPELEGRTPALPLLQAHVLIIPTGCYRSNKKDVSLRCECMLEESTESSKHDKSILIIR